MFFQEDKLIKAILDDDLASARKQFRIPGGRKENNLLHLAAYSNSVRVARFLIDSGEEVNSVNGIGDTPLHVAARYNAWETADLLLSCGARIHSPNHAGQTPLDIAVSSGNSKLAELLRLAAKQPAAK
ncbi:MAG: ankyrin repeat domain-containing protein [Armatimonadota bacterium]|nr:ankyrin repeat domain-containing protein [bacterium]